MYSTHITNSSAYFSQENTELRESPFYESE